MTDTSPAALEKLDRVLETEFDTQKSVEQNPYGAMIAIEEALLTIRALSAQLADADRLIAVKTDWINATINDMAVDMEDHDTALKNARDAALVDAAGVCAGHRYGFPNEMLDSCNLRKRHRADIAAAILALRTQAPEPAQVTVDTVARAIFEASTFFGAWDSQPKSNIEVCESMARAALRAIAGDRT